MTRTQQTWSIIGAIAAAAIFLAWVLWPAPNLDGMTAYEKCSYSSYYANRGGSAEACRTAEVDAARARLMRGF